MESGTLGREGLLELSVGNTDVGTDQRESNRLAVELEGVGTTAVSGLDLSGTHDLDNSLASTVARSLKSYNVKKK